MDYYPMEESLQVLLSENLPLSSCQNTRISQACSAVMLAGSSHLSQIAKWLDRRIQQRSRERWVRRLLDATFMRQEFVYAPLVKYLLSAYRVSRLHISMDRSSLVAGETDLLSLSLLYRKRAIPLVWDVMPTGMSGYERQVALIDRAEYLVPPVETIIFHGDNEFGGIPLLRNIQQRGWEAIVGQNGKNCFHHGDYQWQAFNKLPIQRGYNLYLNEVYVTKEHDYGKLNVVAFY
ncbi:MAG: hypothetical protein AAFR67_14330, partial [Chloroflexota bacterium]